MQKKLHRYITQYTWHIQKKLHRYTHIIYLAYAKETTSNKHVCLDHDNFRHEIFVAYTHTEANQIMALGKIVLPRGRTDGVSANWCDR